MWEDGPHDRGDLLSLFDERLYREHYVIIKLYFDRVSYEFKERLHEVFNGVVKLRDKGLKLYDLADDVPAFVYD